jgi:thiol-disulfide isomerase/thioredoxin
MRWARPLIIGWIVLLTTYACSREGAKAPRSEGPIQLGMYRATLELPGGELPFGLEIAQENGQYVAYLINGSERVRVPEVSVQDGQVEMRMPGLKNVLRAKIDEDELEGDVTLIKLNARQVIPFAAKLGETYRFIEEPDMDAEAGNADFSGRWAAEFKEKSGAAYLAVGEFRQNHQELTGTFLTPTGDHRFLAGEVSGNELFLSAFDGAHAYLYHGQVNSKGELEGTFWSGLASKETFAAHRDETASLGDAVRVTELRSDSTPFSFAFPDLDGRVVALSDPRFAGKVVVVTLAGSWCANSHDVARFLAPYYVQNRVRGLEVVALMFEHSSDFAQAADATRRFREVFKIEYPTLIAGISDKQDAAAKLPQLNGVFAFPTTVFIDRQGRVRRIHTGFSGPATGEHYQQLTEEFDELVQQLLAETDEKAAENRPSDPDA